MGRGITYITMERCTECGKIFAMSCERWMWGYKAKGKGKKKQDGSFYYPTKYFCSWRCLRKWEKKNLPKRENLDDYIK